MDNTDQLLSENLGFSNYLCLKRYILHFKWLLHLYKLFKNSINETKINRNKKNTF